MALDGAWGEAVAAAWAEAQGMRVLARNHRCRRGEVDLVLREGRVLVFAEVKTRATSRLGSGLEAVGWRKQRRLGLAALDWLRRAGIPLEEVPCRFDVVEVRPGAAGSGPAVSWVRDAFALDGLLE